jgi:hypothetical protein
VSQGAEAARVQASLRTFLGMEVTIEQSQRAVRHFHKYQRAAPVVTSNAPKGDGLLQLRSEADVADFTHVVSAVLERDRIRAERAEVAEEQRRQLGRRLMQPMQNSDTSWPVRLVALVPYMLPAVDSCRMFGEALGLQSLAGVDLHGGLLANFWGFMAPVLVFLMPMISSQWRLPMLLRYNLNQAYIFQLLNYIALAHSWSAVLIQTCLANGEAVQVQELVHPTVLPGAELVLLANALCVAYSAGATLLGVVPEHVPVISREARRSTDHMNSK